MIISAKKIGTLLLLFTAILPVKFALGQVKGANSINWYSWDASAGFMMPLNIFKTALPGGIEHTYRFAGAPGFAFSIAKPIGLQIVIGAELEDQRTRGALKGFLSLPADTFYNIRTRTFNLFLQYYLTPNLNINPFIFEKIGYGAVNRAHTYRDLSRSFPADSWDLMIAAGAGVTWHSGPNLSFNLYGEFSSIPAKYLSELFTSLPANEKKIFPTARIVLSVTGHTDIRVFYPVKRGKDYKSKYKTRDFLPYNRVRIRK